MRITTILFLLVSGLIVYAGIEYSTGITGTTQKNGDGCTCHNLNSDPAVWVRIEGPDTLLQGQTAEYTIKLSGGPAVEAGFNVASFSGSLNPVNASVQKFGNELTHSSSSVFTDSIASWTFSFTSQNNNYTDTIYSVGNSVNGDGIPNSQDKWNFGLKFPVVVLDVIPVELISFLAEQTAAGLMLNWATASELNNFGFTIERTKDYINSSLSNNNPTNVSWAEVGFVNGYGTTSQVKHYSFTDNSPLNGTSYYRLKQTDFDGSYTHSDIVEVNIISLPGDFILEQNYPNPFNPGTKISWKSPIAGWQTLKVYDLLGNEVATLIDAYKPAGSYEVSFDASGLTSGIYLYKLISGNFIETKKMLLLK